MMNYVLLRPLTEKNTVIHLEDGQFDLWNSLNGDPGEKRESHAEGR